MKELRALMPGGTIGLVGPSGAIRSEDGLRRAVDRVVSLGFKAKLGESSGKVYGYLSGEDALRAGDVNNMFMDDEVDAIVCLRGGYGTPRILDMLDYDAAANHPKLFVGYSDITAMQLAYYHKSGLVSIHGPMPVSCWIGEKFSDFSMDSILRAMTGAAATGEVKNPNGFELETVVEGRAEGVMIGGNLTLLSGLLGTPYSPDYRGKILFLEDIGERTYRLDHMLTHLRLAGVFEDCAGVVLGDFQDCPVEYPDFGLTLPEIIRDVIAPCGKPVLSGLMAGHCEPKVSLPLGIRYGLDAGAKKLVALESMFEE